MNTWCGASFFLLGLAASASAVTIAFDDFSNLPALDARASILDANGGSVSYGGVTWDSRLSVVGRDYRTDAGTPGPLFGLPQSGDYFITQDTSAPLYGDGFTLATSMVLTGAWFGRNEYYGFGGGADQITIYALNGATELGSVVFDLPETAAGQPEPLSFVDTSAFLALSGITGYRIDRTNPNAGPSSETSANWVADSFEFVAVPEPGAITLAALGGLAFAGRRIFRRR